MSPPCNLGVPLALWPRVPRGARTALQGTERRAGLVTLQNAESSKYIQTDGGLIRVPQRVKALGKGKFN